MSLLTASTTCTSPICQHLVHSTVNPRYNRPWGQGLEWCPLLLIVHCNRVGKEVKFNPSRMARNAKLGGGVFITAGFQGTVCPCYSRHLHAAHSVRSRYQKHVTWHQLVRQLADVGVGWWMGASVHFNQNPLYRSLLLRGFTVLYALKIPIFV